MDIFEKIYTHLCERTKEDILAELLDRVKYIDRKYDEIDTEEQAKEFMEGLGEPEKGETWLALWHEYAINNNNTSIDNAAQETGMTFDEVEDWLHKNL